MGSTAEATVGAELGVLAGAGHSDGERAPAETRPRRSFAVPLVAIGVVLAVFAFAPFIIAAVDAAHRHRDSLGVDSWDPMDGLQYLAWVRDAHNGLIRNLFGSGRDGAVFLHPMWSPSGWVQAATGVSDTAIMAFWTAVGALVLLAGCARLVVQQLPPERPTARVIALCLALFGGLTPLVLLLPAIDIAAPNDARLAGEDLISAASLWGYAPMAIAVGLMPFAIEGVSRLIDGRRDRRTVLGTAALGLLVAWLHPWQGESLIAVSAGLAAWWLYDRSAARSRWGARSRGGARARPAAGPPDRRPGGRHDRRRLMSGLGAPLLVLVATAAPLLYYLILSKVDAGWAVAELADRAATIPWPLIVLCVAPLALLAVIAGRRAGGDHAARGLALWPLATLLVVAGTRSGQDRALVGIGIPVAVLLVRVWPTGLHRARWVLAAAAGVAATLVPAGIYVAETINGLGSPYFTTVAELKPSDVRASALAARASGEQPILAPAALGTAIPALTDAASWVGHPIWTPDYGSRAQRSGALFAGSMTGPQARAFVRAVGTRALVEPCGWTARLEPALAPLGFRQVQVGCSRVYLLPG
jgi:hypothetical protein